LFGTLTKVVGEPLARQCPVIGEQCSSGQFARRPGKPLITAQLTTENRSLPAAGHRPLTTAVSDLLTDH
jgi:hypothetical protein